MLRIYIDLELLDLLPNTSIQLEINNPIFDSEGETIKGSFSLPFTIPLTDRNRILLGFPDVLDNVLDVRRTFPVYIESDGETIQGTLKIRGIKNLLVTCNVTTGISAIAKGLQERKLKSFAFGGLRTLGGNLEEVKAKMFLNSSYPDDNDFIFAPIKNPVVAGESDIDDFFTEHFINDYAFSEFVLTPGDSTTHPRGLCPFPKLKYVLLQALKELGLQVEQSFFDAELDRLFIVSSGGLERISFYKQGEVNHYVTSYQYQFRIGDLLPDLTVVELLRKLILTFGLSLQVTLNNKLILGKLNDLIESSDYVECSHLTSPVADQEIADPENFDFVYNLDGEDAQVGEAVQDFSDVTLLEPVSSYFVLQTTYRKSFGNAQANDVRFVEETRKYYKYSYTLKEVGWFYYSDDFAPVRSGSGEASEIAQGIVPVICQPTILNGQEVLMPNLKLKRDMPENGLANPSPDLRLLFYRGFQPYMQGLYYPLLTDHIYNTQKEQIGQYSLRLDGAHGTHQTFLKKWYDFRSKMRPIKKQIAWNMVDISNLDLSKKLNIHGNRYLVRKLTITLPIRKPIEAELCLV